VTVATAGPQPWRAAWEGVELKVLPHTGYATASWGGKRWDFRQHGAFLWETWTHEYDVVHSHNYGYLRLLRGKMELMHFHSDPLYRDESIRGWRPEDFDSLLKAADNIVTVSRFVAGRVVQGINRRMPAWVVPNGLDAVRYQSPLARVAGRRLRDQEVVLVQPTRVHHAEKVDDNSLTKCDAKDAGTIGWLVRDGRWFRWEPSGGVWADFATLAVAGRQLYQEVLRWWGRITGWLETLTARFQAVTQHRVGAKQAHALMAAVRESMGVPVGRSMAQRQLVCYLASWRAARAAQSAMEAKQASINADFAVTLLLASIPGVGPQFNVTVLEQLGDLSRFEDSRQAQKRTELNRPHESSGHHHGKTRVAKKELQWKAWFQHLARPRPTRYRQRLPWWRCRPGYSRPGPGGTTIANTCSGRRGPSPSPWFVVWFWPGRGNSQPFDGHGPCIRIRIARLACLHVKLNEVSIGYWPPET
jgi:hypothetical protein